MWYFGRLKNSENLMKLRKSKDFTKIESNNDLNQILKLAEAGANFIIVDTLDWRIIPLENVIATLQTTNTKIYAPASALTEIRTLFSVLEFWGGWRDTDNPRSK